MLTLSHRAHNEKMPPNLCRCGELQHHPSNTMCGLLFIKEKERTSLFISGKSPAGSDRKSSISFPIASNFPGIDGAHAEAIRR